MKWDRLKYFHIVSQTLNLKKASDIMNISHSSLSRQISVLENEMKI
ncbi:LysR family transcriptional regulator, partial [Alphaproteobacteria bacterium]|nr:LysR family transcriptional regulator [Alphaproteobacteria bacterium]